MKPVKLAIEGINSFTERQELDFDAVGRSNLFCICGKTGAGKTTVFDSIMFALYGSSNRGTLADMVNLTLMRARVEFEFAEGADIYRVERSIKCRAERDDKDGKKQGKTNSGEPVPGARRVAVTECLLYVNGEPKAKGGEANELLANIIGLDKDEFKNVYLLEQGEYADFLKKTPAKQTEAIGKIFSLLRYADVYKLASDKKRECDAEIKSIEDRMRDLGLDSPDRLRATANEAGNIKSKITALGKQVQKLKDELIGLDKAHDEYLAYNEKANNLKRQQLSADDAKKAYEIARSALAEFEENNKDALPKRKEKLNKLRDEQGRLNKLNTSDKDYSAAVEKLRVKTVEAETCAKRYESERTACIALGEREENAKARFFDVVEEFISRAAETDRRSPALDNALKALTSDERRVGTVGEQAYALRTELNDHNNLCSLVESAQKRIAELTASRDAATEKIKIYAAEINAQTDGENSAKTAVERAETALLSAQTNSHAAAIRAELKAGDACPVCGNRYCGIAETGDADVDVRKTELKAARDRLDEIKVKKTALERNVEKAKGDFERASDELKSADEELNRITARMEKSGVTARHSQLIELLDKAKLLGEKYSEAHAEKIKREPELARLKAELDGAETGKAETAARIEELRVLLGDNLGKTEDGLKAASAAIESAEVEIAAIEREHNALINGCASAKATADALERAIEEARRDCPVDMPSFDDDAYAEKKRRREALDGEYNALDRELAAKSVQIESLTEKCNALKKCEGERSVATKRSDNYETIMSMTKNKALLNFVVAEYMTEITSIASEILSELSNGKYTLDYDNDNGFTVTDYLSGGGKRKASTLSGGEMFLASLSVAIAIARAQSRGNNAFFFLDEGFGTLDDELIDTVFGALDILSKDCLVGVISHASALIERMPVCVEVMEATDTAGSVIKY